MKKSIAQLWVLTVLTVATFQQVYGGTFTWSGASGANLYWKTPANWTPPPGPPGVNDFSQFFDLGATNIFGVLGTDSEVTNNLSIKYLWLSQTNNFHNILIDAGVTLTVGGTNDNGYGPLGSNPLLTAPTNAFSTVYVGTRLPALVTTIVSNSISGPGTLFLNNSNNELNIREFQASGGGTHQATLDLSGLNTFVARLGRIRVGDGEAGIITRAQGQLRLAITNTITLSGAESADNVDLVVGNNDVNNNGNSSISVLFLGQTNRLNLGSILVGAQKQQGQMVFNPLFASPSLVIRGSDGVSRAKAIRVGDEGDAGATGSPSTGLMNFLPGTVDILVDTLLLGKSQNGNNTSAATGTFQVGTGTVDVNTMILAAQANKSFGGVVTGTASFSNTTVTVNSLLQMGSYIGANFARVANLNINGGSFTVNGAYQNQGTVTINVTNATLKLPSTASVLAKTIQLDGGILANAAILKITNALNIYNNGSISGAPVLDMGSFSSPATWDVQGIAGGSLIVSNALKGAGTINGNVTQAPGATISPGGINLAGTLTLGGTSGNLTLNDGGTVNFDLSPSSVGVNDHIFPGGAITVNGTNNIFLKSLGGSLDTATPYTLIQGATLTASSNQFKVVGPLTSGRYTFAFDTTTVPNAVLLVVGGTGPANQIWVGDGSVNTWDAQGAFNWNNGSASQFFTLDNVTFNDSGSAAPAVNLSGALVPGLMTVSNSVKNYAFGGSGSVAVSGQFTKIGAGSLTISNLSDNTFSSLTTVSNGAVTLANKGQNTFQSGINLVGGSMTWSGISTNIIEDPGTGLPVITIGTGTILSVKNSNANVFNSTQLQLDGTLAFAQSADAIFDAVLIDAGAFVQSGPGTLTMAGNNGSFSGPVLINGGTISAGSTISALGTGPITITNTGALDVNGKNIGASPVTVSGSGPTGAGAIVNNGSPQNTSLTATTTALQSVALASNTVFGGAGQWNTDPVRNGGYWVVTGTLSTGGTNYNLAKTGSNQVSLINATVDPALGNINVQQGMLNFQGSTTSMGDPGSNLTVSAGATLSFYDTSIPWTKNFILFGDGVTANIFNYDGTHILAGPVTLNGNCVIGGAPPGRGVPVSLTLSAAVTGSGSLIKSASDTLGTLILTGTNTYTGTTTVAGGTLIVDGINGTNSMTVTGGTLGGFGIIKGPVTVSASGTLSPGDVNFPTATLSVSNSLSVAGTTMMDVTKAGGVFTCDVVTNITTLTLGGTLQLNLPGDPLASGDSFQLFSFNSASGGVSAIIPDSPGAGLAWDSSHLTTDGTLRVITVNQTPTNLIAQLSGGLLNLSWPADHIGWRLQMQANDLNTGLDMTTNWVDVSGSTIVNMMSIPIDMTAGSIFYRMTYP